MRGQFLDPLLPHSNAEKPVPACRLVALCMTLTSGRNLSEGKGMTEAETLRTKAQAVMGNAGHSFVQATTFARLDLASSALLACPL